LEECFGNTDKLVVIDGGDKKKSNTYLVPKSKGNLYGDNEVCFNISKTL
jgi:hypothetical protein